MSLRRSALLMALAAMLAAGPAWTVFAATDLDERRVRIGVRLFRTALAADTAIGDKLNADGALHLLIVYRDDAQLAGQAQAELIADGQGGASPRLFDWPMRVETIAAASFIDAPPADVAGIYLVQDLDEPLLQSVIGYGVAHHRVVYSAVDGHVERGVLAGLDIGVRVLPYVNDQTLKASKLELKSLFLKVAKHHE